MAIKVTHATGMSRQDVQRIFTTAERLRPTLAKPASFSSVKQHIRKRILPTLDRISEKPVRQGYLGRKLNARERTHLEYILLEAYHSEGPEGLASQIEEINRTLLVRYPRTYVSVKDLEATVIIVLYGTDGEYQVSFRLRADSEEEMRQAVIDSDIDTVAIVMKIALILFSLLGITFGGASLNNITAAMRRNPRIMGLVDKLIAAFKLGSDLFEIVRLLADLVVEMADDPAIWKEMKAAVGGFFKLLGKIGKLLLKLVPIVGVALTIAAVAGPTASLLAELGVPIPGWLLAVLGQDPSGSKPAPPPEPRERPVEPEGGRRIYRPPGGHGYVPEW